MSAKICDVCDEQIVFGKDVESGKPIPLDNLTAIYQIVDGEKVRFVSGGYRARHRCRPKITQEPQPSFVEPKELPWSASE